MKSEVTWQEKEIQDFPGFFQATFTCIPMYRVAVLIFFKQEGNKPSSVQAWNIYRKNKPKFPHNLLY